MSLQGEVRSSKLHRRIELYVWPLFNRVSNLERRERRNRVHFELESVIEKELESRAKRSVASSEVQLSVNIGSGDGCDSFSQLQVSCGIDTSDCDCNDT